MASPETREKVAATLREVGHEPRARGGNGTPIPGPQRVLAKALGWETEFVVAPSDGQRPYHYKLDIAEPEQRVCVEVDGGSHGPLARQAADAKRDRRLRACGWSVFRFSNQDAMERTEECVRTVLSTTWKSTRRTPI